MTTTDCTLEGRTMDSKTWHEIVDSQNPEIIWDWLTEPQRRLLARFGDGDTQMTGGQWQSYNFLVVYGLVFGGTLKPFGRRVLRHGQREAPDGGATARE